MYRYNNPQTAAVMSIGMKALRTALDTVDVELFITTLKTDQFNYTEWRRDNIWKGMTANEIFDQAVETEKKYTIPEGVEVI